MNANDIIDATDVLKIEAFAVEAKHLNLTDVEKLTIAAGFTTAKKNGEQSKLKEHPHEMEVFKRANTIKKDDDGGDQMKSTHNAEMGDFKIPVITLETSTDEELTEALETTGFFYLK